MPISPRFADRVRDLTGSPIREILSSATRPGMVSFAGGLPAPETFPSFAGVRLPAPTLQYGPTEGEAALREKVAAYLAGLGLRCPKERVLILAGSQQGIDFAAKLFAQKGTPVAVPSPAYLAALQVFRFFGARFQPFNEADPSFGRPRPSLLYCNPTFQNPTGKCWSLEERRRVAAACEASGVVLFEDDPYREIAFGPCERRPVCSFLKKGSWIYQGSFSKTLCPGLRIGFLASSEDLALHLNRLKQSADLHTNRVGQHLVLSQWGHAAWEKRRVRLVDFYRRRRDEFSSALRETFGRIAAWEEPQGGLFYWLRLRRPVDTRVFFQEALGRKVAFMPGEYFFPEARPKKGFFRLNYSHARRSDARRGLKILAKLMGS